MTADDTHADDTQREPPGTPLSRRLGAFVAGLAIGCLLLGLFTYARQQERSAQEDDRPAATNQGADKPREQAADQP